MPTYEYLCEKCDHEFEREQRISDPPVKTCPVCRSRKVTKLISRTSFVLKGGGWYSDLYSSSKGKSDDSASGSDSGGKSSDSSSGDSSKKESKSKDEPKAKDSKAGGKSGTPSKKSAA